MRLDEVENAALVPGRPWRSRLLALPYIPGPAEQWITDLAATLRIISTSDVPSDSPMWLGESLGERGEPIFRRLHPYGLVKKNESGCVILTDEAETWLENQNAAYFVSLLHNRFRFIGEALSAIAEGERTAEKLLKIASDDYSLGWTSLDQVRRRVSLLRVAGFVDKWNHHEVAANDAGIALLERLNVEPSNSASPLGPKNQDAHTFVPEAGPRISELVSSLTDETLSSRKRNLGFIPAGTEGETSFEGLRRLVTFCAPRIEKIEFVKAVSAELGLSPSSAESALSALRVGGLIQQAGLDLYEPTPWAAEWLETSNPLDLIRILHSHILMFGELVKIADDLTDIGTFLIIAQGLLGADSPQRSEINTRLRLLTAAGLLDKANFTTYVSTPLGREFIKTIACLSTVGQEVEPTEEHEDDAETPLQQLISELRAAAVDSRNSDRFERAVHTSMVQLGFNARLLGGPGRTDVLLSIWVGPGKQRRVIVDAKTASSGEVVEGAISFDAIEEHKTRHSAEKVAIIGPSFPDGRVATWARRRGVQLIDVDTLVRYLQMNDTAPLPASTLIGIFDTDVADPKAIWDRALRRQDVLQQVIGTLWREANDEREISRSGGALDVNALRYLLRDKIDPDPEEIQEVLEFLASPVLQAVGKVRDKYLPLEAPEITAARLRSLGALPSRPTHARRSEPKAVGANQSQEENLPTVPKQIDLSLARKWAIEKGLNVRDKGRLPAAAIKAYLQDQEAESS
ncbi:hypothetical protein [Micromonospora parva]|uniref:hypothetical protein n=1 Tax=Micromonospora parva TaxID=1464048 RepID=UPI00366768C5